MKSDSEYGGTIFFSLVRSRRDLNSAGLMVKGLRNFGGALAGSPCRIYFPRNADFETGGIDWENTEFLRFKTDEAIESYMFADKVTVCAEAERDAPNACESLVWLNCKSLIVNPPIEFLPDSNHDAAFRPVHIKNIGSPAAGSTDDYWQTVYDKAGLTGTDRRITSYVDSAELRPCCNTHLFPVDPAGG